jgi:hypothetical protein
MQEHLETHVTCLVVRNPRPNHVFPLQFLLADRPPASRVRISPQKTR